MLKMRDKNGISKKYESNTKPKLPYQLDDLIETPNRQRFETMQSRYSKVGCRNELKSDSSSLVDQSETLANKYESFQASVLKKVETIQQQTNQLRQKKERELYFMKIQISNNEERLAQAEQILRLKDEEIDKLQSEIQILNRQSTKYLVTQDYRLIKEENENLKQSLKFLIQEKNENQKYQNKKNSNSNFSRLNVKNLKKQVQELRSLVKEMQDMISNCPSCFTFKRDNQELTVAYSCLIKEHSQLKQMKSQQEKNLLQNITRKIQENQNILRENHHLHEEKRGRPYLRPRKGEKLTQSVAKRCRTLTDQF